MLYMPALDPNAAALSPGITLPTGIGDVFSSEFSATRAQQGGVITGNLSDALSKQDALARQLGVTDLPNPIQTLNAFSKSQDGTPFAPEGERDIASYNSRIADLKLRFPNQPFQTMDEIYTGVAQQAKQAQQDAAEIAGRAPGVKAALGGFLGGSAATFTDPVQLLTLATPMSLEAFGGSLAFRLLKLAGTQALAQGGATAVDELPMRNFYRAQGMSEDDINEKLWHDIGGNALAGAVFAPGIELGGMQVGKIFDALKGGSLAERQAAIDALAKSKVDLGPATKADIANQAESLHYESTNPFPPTVDSNRFHFANIDDIGRSIEDGSYDPFASASRMAMTAEQGGIRPFELTDDLAKELGLSAGPAKLKEVNAALDANMGRGMLQSAQAEADEAATRISNAESRIADLEGQHNGIRGELNKELPSADALQLGGLDPDTTAALKDIEDRLAAPRLSKKARGALEAQREGIVQSVAGDIDQAKQGLSDHADQLQAQLRDANKELNNATRTKANADNEVERVQKIADKAQRTLDNLQSERDVNAVTPDQPSSTAQLTPDIINAIRDRRVEAKRPMTAGEVADTVKRGDEVAAGKYDAGIVDDAKGLLEQHGDITLVDENGERYSIKDRLAELEDDEAELQKVLACLGA